MKAPTTQLEAQIREISVGIEVALGEEGRLCLLLGKLLSEGSPIASGVRRRLNETRERIEDLQLQEIYVRYQYGEACEREGRATDALSDLEEMFGTTDAASLGL